MTKNAKMHFKNNSLKHKRVEIFFSPHYVFFTKGFCPLSTDKGSYLLSPGLAEDRLCQQLSCFSHKSAASRGTEKLCENKISE